MRTKITTLLCILMLLVLAACSSDPLAPAREAAAEGDREGAIAAFTTALTEEELDDTQRASALYERGFLYADKLIQLDDSDNDRARDDMFGALDIVQSSAEPIDLPLVAGLQMLANNYTSNENYEAVIEVADKGLTIEPSNARLLQARGSAHLQLRNFEQAISDLKGSLQGEVDAASAETDGFLGLYDAYFRLGRAMLDVGEYDEATTAFTTAIDEASGDEQRASALSERGFVYGEVGENELAIADLDEAITLDPSLAIAYAYRSYSHSSLGDYDSSIEDANQAVELGGDLGSGTRSAILHSRAFANLQVGEYQAALADATDSIDLAGLQDPSAARTYAMRSNINRLLTNYDDAVSDATQAIEVGSSDVTALDGFYYRRAQAHYALGDYTPALEDLDAAVEIGGPIANRFELRGDIYEQLGDVDAALASYDQAISLAPNDPWLQNYKGDIYYNAEDYVNAEAGYRAAIAIDDQNDIFHSNLGYALREQERYDEAVEAYSAALAIYPDDPWGWYARGLAHYFNFDDAAAIADMEKALEIGGDDEVLVERANEILAELQ